MKLGVFETGHADQYNIQYENGERFNDEGIYLNFSGYFGKHSAHLFAAAPELLEALELALEYIQSCPDQLSASGQVAREAARAAIAKAKGETA